MYVRKGFTAFLVVLLIAYSLPSPASQPEFADRPGTIVHAVSLPLGSTVYLDAMEVAFISADRFTVSEWWSDRTLPVSMVPPPALTLGQLVDVEGVTGRLANGDFAILNPHVYGYLDKDGNLLSNPWVIKFPDKPCEWRWGKVDMTTIFAGEGLMSGMETMESGELLDATPGTIPWAKNLPDGALPQALNGKVITAGTNQFSGCIYIEESDRQCGIKVQTAGSFVPGQTVNVTAGTMADDANGERYIASATVVADATAAVPDPVFMIQRSLGGGAFGYQQEVIGGTGLNNIGLLLHVVGKITYNGGTFAYIDDGSAADDGSGYIGVRVETDHLATGNSITLPAAGDGMFAVKGISSCMVLNNEIVRVLRPRDQSDVTNRSSIEIDISSPSASSTNGDPVTYTVTYQGADTVILADVHIEINTTGTAYGDVGVSGSGNTTRTVTISNITGDGTIGISIVPGTASNSGGNAAPGAGPSETFAVDTAPLIFVSPPSHQTTKNGPITYAVTYDAASTVTLAEIDITLNKTGTADGAVTVSGEGNTDRTVTISGLSGQGTLGIYIAAGTASDGGGNYAEAAGPSATFSVVRVFFVRKSDGSDSDPGTSWDLAVATVQRGIDLAYAAGGCEVWVARAWYNQCIYLKSGVALYGGFSGNEIGREERNSDPVQAGSELDGQFYDTVVTVQPGAGATTMVDGFYIHGGWGTSGGGISCVNASPTISNNWITDNYADDGGGVYCYGGSPKILNNTIEANNAYSGYYVGGGGIACYDSSPEISGNMITDNEASYYGGGVYCSNCSVIASGNTITGNLIAGEGGGIACRDCTSVILSDNKIEDNRSTYGPFSHGGGIYCYNSTATISSCMVTGNTVEGYGGGIAGDDSSLQVYDSIIENNTAQGIGGGFGSFYSTTLVVARSRFEANTTDLFGGGICLNSGSADISNSLFIRNQALGDGGGAIQLSCSANIGNNTFAHNSTQGHGGAIRFSLESGVSHIFNNAFYNNSAVLGGLSVYANSELAHTISNCNAYPGSGDIQFVGQGLVITNPSYTDPLFVDAANDDYHLLPDTESPCIDLGTDGPVGLDWLDIDYEARISGEHVDVGADEYTSDADESDPTIPIYVAAVATGETESSDLKICVYWSEVEGATGYNVYRATTSEAQVYENPLNGSTPVTALAYDGARVYIFTDSGDLEADTEYFYTVKALGAWGESDPSGEASCTPDPNGIPWDSGDPDLILPSVREAFPDDPIPQGSLTSFGPDGRYYRDGTSTWLLPEGYVDRKANTVILDDGQTQFAANADEDGETESGLGILGAPLPNARSGPFRRIATKAEVSYRGAKGKINLPGAPTNVKGNQTIFSKSDRYPNGDETKDVPYVYLGLKNMSTLVTVKDRNTGRLKRVNPDVEGGVCWHPWQRDTVGIGQGKIYRWRLYMKSNVPAIRDPGKGLTWHQDIPRCFDGPIGNVGLQFHVSTVKDGEVLLKVTLPDGTIHPMTRAFPANAFPKSAKGVRVRRVHSIAQNNLQDTADSQDWTNGYRKTGTRFLGSEWIDGHVWWYKDSLSNPHWWGVGQTASSDEGAFPPSQSIVSYYLVPNPDFKRYAEDRHVNINLEK